MASIVPVALVGLVACVTVLVRLTFPDQVARFAGLGFVAFLARVASLFAFLARAASLFVDAD